MPETGPGDGLLEYRVDVVPARLDLLPAVTSALDELAAAARRLLPRTADGRDLDDRSREQQVLLAGVLPVSVIELAGDTAAGRMWELGERGRHLGTDHWPGGTLGRTQATAGTRLLDAWAQLVGTVPYPDNSRRTVLAALDTARAAWAALIPDQSDERGLTVTAAAADPVTVAALHRIADRLDLFAAATIHSHRILGHGKSFEPSAGLTLRRTSTGIRADLDLGSYQFSHLLGARHGPVCSDLPLDAIPSRLDDLLAPMWPDLAGLLTDIDPDYAGDTSYVTGPTRDAILAAAGRTPEPGTDAARHLLHAADRYSDGEGSDNGHDSGRWPLSGSGWRPVLDWLAAVTDALPTTRTRAHGPYPRARLSVGAWFTTASVDGIPAGNAHLLPDDDLADTSGAGTSAGDLLRELARAAAYQQQP